MGRLGDLGWAIRERLSVGLLAVLLAVAGLGAGIAGLVIALDAKDRADEAAAGTLPAPPPAVPAEEADSELSAQVAELNERVAAIEESVSQLRTDLAEEGPTGGAEPVPEATPAPEPPELPEELPEIPGVGVPEQEPPPKPRP